MHKKFMFIGVSGLSYGMNRRPSGTQEDVPLKCEGERLYAWLTAEDKKAEREALLRDFCLGYWGYFQKKQFHYRSNRVRSKRSKQLK